MTKTVLPSCIYLLNRTLYRYFMSRESRYLDHCSLVFMSYSLSIVEHKFMVILLVLIFVDEKL